MKVVAKTILPPASVEAAAHELERQILYERQFGMWLRSHSSMRHGACIELLMVFEDLNEKISGQGAG
jgi:hypothetical protein